MPRLAPSLLRFAGSRDPHLARLLRECRDLTSATNELRWLTEFASDDRLHRASQLTPDARLTQYVHRRSRGEPLQYILGNQPFGDLDILCRSKVLIPRPETEVYTTTLARFIRKLRSDGVIRSSGRLMVADLCTGTGCIALLLHALLRPAASPVDHIESLSITGVDVSAHALSLASDNLNHNVRLNLLHAESRRDVSFQHMDVLELGNHASQLSSVSSHDAEDAGAETLRFLNQNWHVIVCNPPYISPSDYAPGGTVGRSVRNYEPRLALVPPADHHAPGRLLVDQADQFYAAVMQVALKAQTSLVVMEIGDAKQATRVRELATRIMSEQAFVETWRDDGSAFRHHLSDDPETLKSCSNVQHERAIVVWTGSWAEWRRGQNHNAHDQ